MARPVGSKQSTPTEAEIKQYWHSLKEMAASGDASAVSGVLMLALWCEHLRKQAH
jgi:hypothetical protein